jgi:prephenate dehydratase/chorismate mutase/prephenate dehydratase
MGKPLVRVAFQGELGAFSEEAIQQVWLGGAEPVPERDFGDVIQAVSSAAVDRGVIPFENTIVGAIAAAHDALAASEGLHVIAETVVNVHHCLLGPPGATFEGIKGVFSHPVALAQCGAFFARHKQIEVHPVYDTGGAALDVASVGDPAYAAVASRTAGHRYKLAVLAADIEDRAEPAVLPAGTPVRTTLLFSHDDRPGALLQVLDALARHGVDIRRLESRPTGDPWSYRYFVEFDHAVGDGRVDAVVAEMTATAQAMRRLGTYPRWNPGRRGSIGWNAAALPVVE